MYVENKNDKTREETQTIKLYLDRLEKKL